MKQELPFAVRTQLTSSSTPLDDMLDGELIGAWQLIRRTMATIESHLASSVSSIPVLSSIPPLSTQACEALTKLATAPGHKLPMSELAHGVGLSSGGLTKVVDRLVGAGLVARLHSATDRRVIFAVLTEEGTALADAATPLYAMLLRHELGGLGRQDLTVLRSLCGKLAAHTAAPDDIEQPRRRNRHYQTEPTR